AEDVRRDDIALVLADMGERPKPGDVSDRPQAVRHAQAGVDRNPVRIRLDTDGLETEVGDAWPAAGGDEQAIAAQLTAVLELDNEVRPVASRRGRVRGQHELDSLVPQDIAERLTERR